MGRGEDFTVAVRHSHDRCVLLVGGYTNTPLRVLIFRAPAPHAGLKPPLPLDPVGAASGSALDPERRPSTLHWRGTNMRDCPDATSAVREAAVEALDRALASAPGKGAPVDITAALNDVRHELSSRFGGQWFGMGGPTADASCSAEHDPGSCVVLDAPAGARASGRARWRLVLCVWALRVGLA